MISRVDLIHTDVWSRQPGQSTTWWYYRKRTTHMYLSEYPQSSYYETFRQRKENLPHWSQNMVHNIRTRRDRLLRQSKPVPIDDEKVKPRKKDQYQWDQRKEHVCKTKERQEKEHVSSKRGTKSDLLEYPQSSHHRIFRQRKESVRLVPKSGAQSIKHVAMWKGEEE